MRITTLIISSQPRLERRMIESKWPVAKEEPLHSALPKTRNVVAARRLPTTLAHCVSRSKLAAIIVGVSCAIVPATALFAQYDPNPSPSIGDRISSGFSSIGHALSPAPEKPAEEDPIALKTPAKLVRAMELYVAVARVYEEAGKFEEAEEQYRAAMKIAPNDLRVLLGYAKLKDRTNESDEADRNYQQAATKFPAVPAVFNNMAGHYAHQGKLREAMAAMEKAIQLRPREPRYRTNLAALLVASGRNNEAFDQLRTVYDEPIAHYDLGFLLNRQGAKQAAVQQFAIAQRSNWSELCTAISRPLGRRRSCRESPGRAANGAGPTIAYATARLCDSAATIDHAIAGIPATNGRPAAGRTGTAAASAAATNRPTATTRGASAAANDSAANANSRLE